MLRTIRQGVAPSELVVSISMRNKLREFLVVGSADNELAKFVYSRQVIENNGNLTAAA